MSVDSNEQNTAAEDEHDREAREWLANVYQGDSVRQLSIRSIITGMLIGGVMSISNLYVGLKTGWGLGVTITSCIIAYAVFKALERVVPAWRNDHFTILENYTMSSAASAAGYMSSAGLVSAIPALYMVTDRRLAWWELMAWLSAVSLLGVFMAIPLKRQMINVDKLPFPMGTATAETLKSMHTSGADALRKAWALLWAAILGGVLGFWKEGVKAIGEWTAKTNTELGERISGWALPDSIPLVPTEEARRWMKQLTIGFDGSIILVAAGAIMGLRAGVSLLLGAIVFYGVIGQELHNRGIVGMPHVKSVTSWTLWPSVALMVSASLVSFALRWKTIVRSFQGLASVFTGVKKDDPLARIEVPGSWFATGTLISGAACVILGHYLFGIVWWMGILAVVVSFLLSIVAARATGETDVTPIGAMGKITQLLYGYLAPTSLTTNLMTASITAGSASHSADLLTDLKCGYLLGGNPRKQTISQLFGVLAGTLVCVPVFALVADPAKLGGEDLPAPAAKVWAGVAEMLVEGIDSLPPGAKTGILIGAMIGVLLAVAEEFTPVKHRKWIPSSTGLGLAGVLPAANSISMFLGSLIAWWLAKSKPAIGERYTIPVSSGLIAGESLMSVTVIMVVEGPGMVEKLLSGA